MLKEPKDDLERIHAVLWSMVSDDDPLTLDVAVGLLFPLLEGSPALERAIKAHGADLLARNTESAIRNKRGVFAREP